MPLEEKSPGYVPHGTYVDRHNAHYHEQLPPDPRVPTIAIEQVHGEAPTTAINQPTETFLQPIAQAHNPRIRQQYLPPGTTPLITQGLSPVPSTGSIMSPHNLSPASFMQTTPRRTSMQIVYGGLKSSWSETSLARPPTFILKMREFITRYIVEWWLAEILSWLFSALCFCTIIAVLFYYDGRRLPQWPMGLTLNGFISVFSGLAKSALLLPTCEAVGQLKWNWFREEPRSLIDFEVMDAASRGPWGAILLLWRSMQQRGLAIASIGAAIIILSLPFDLFFQQVISYPTVWLPFTPNSTIAIAQTYTSPGLMLVNGTASLRVDPVIAPAMAQLFYSNSTVPPVASFCPANNCTWEPLDTLAVCGMCDDDVSDFLEFGCFDGSGEWLTDSFFIHEPESVPNTTACGWYLNSTSDSRVLMTGYAVDPITGQPDETLDSRVFPLVDSLTRERRYGGSIKFKDLTDPLIDVLIAATPGGAKAVHARTKPLVQECALVYCTHTLNTTVAWGAVHETPISTFIDRSFAGSSAWTAIECPDCTNGVDYYYSKNISLPIASMHGGSDITAVPAEDKIMGVTNETFVSVSFALDDIAPSFFTTTNKSNMISGHEPESFYKFRTFYPTGAYNVPVLVNPWLPPFDIATRWEEVAKTLTAIIRNKPAEDGNLQLVEGSSWNSEVFVKIRWAWMIVPMCLLALGLGLLCVTVIRSSRESSMVGIWKNSVVAILFNGLDESTQKSVNPNCGLAEARTKARDLMVNLVPD